MKTRRELFARNAELQSRLAACGPDMTLSRKELHARLQAARAEVDALAARVSSLTAKTDAQQAEIQALKQQATEVSA